MFFSKLITYCSVDLIWTCGGAKLNVIQVGVKDGDGSTFYVELS